KTVEFISDGVNVLLIDPFPPGTRDPQGVHALIWEHYQNDKFKLPRSRKLTVVSYQTEPDLVAYVEPIAVGEKLPLMPLFLRGEFYINVPLEDSYQTTCKVMPPEMRAP